MNLLLALAVAVQQPQVDATVNRTEAEVGDEIVVTISVTADGGTTTEVSLPPFSGLDLIGTSQSTVFTSTGAGGRREATWQYRFRAAAPGRAVIGPIRVRVGSDFIDAGELSVTVTAVGGEGAGTEFDERIAAIIAAAPGPGGAADVTVQVIPSHDTIVLGEQLDLVVVAWFPRDIRSRLRASPTLTPPELQGAWTYPHTAALGVADTRVVDGRRYDLFIHHQVAFPLTAGELQVGHAAVSYSLPLRTSILSREVPQEVQSKDTTVVVLPQPLEDRPQPFTGAAARNLEFTVTVDTGDFGIGNASTITAKVTGEGNVSLWPRPAFRWPEGVRVYEGRTAVDIITKNGMIGGTKTFTYLVAPESTGTYVVPPATYSYFALDSGRYVQATVPRVRLVARAARPSARRVVRPPPIMPRRGAVALEDLESRIRLWMLGLIAGLPPLLACLVRVGVAIRRRKPVERTRATAPALEALEQEFRANLERLVPDLNAREGDGLPVALRAAGVEAPLATHASRVRDRLRQALYGPEGTSDPIELRAEVNEVLRVLPGGRHRGRGMVRAAGLVGVLGLVWAGAASAQSTTAEQLYEAGAFRAAADSFLIRASQQPVDPSQWFNAGAALFGAGEETAARVAWVKAARVAPRNGKVRAALQLVPPVNSHARTSTWVAPVTVMELALVGTILWLVGWLTYTFSARARRALPVAAVGLVVAGLAAYLHNRYTDPVGLVLVPNVAVREAPYGTSQATTRFAQGAAVRIERSEGAWLLVRRGVYQGWVLRAKVGRL